MSKYAVRIITTPRPGPFDSKESTENLLEAYLAGIAEDLGPFAKLISVVPFHGSGAWLSTWEV